MEIRGKVIERPWSESGTSARGPWKRAYIVVRYEDGQYPKDLLLSSMRKADDVLRLQVGQTGTFKFDARTRKATNGKWYCELECWDFVMDQQSYGGGYQQGPI